MDAVARPPVAAHREDRERLQAARTVHAKRPPCWTRKGPLGGSEGSDRLRTTEPPVTCSACAHTAPLGDWAGEWTCQVGELGVCFNNWPLLRPEFTQELGRRLGPRRRVVHSHY
ncbi:hypothetical protein ACIRRH_42510 [Kitasatospora sp. NPDC101235]|uniref:hypothetical protein n=1 Tax=Kitasatospora sp. NPDC101235 TaxID=3364101 RepID=UPI00380EA3B4